MTNPGQTIWDNKTNQQFAEVLVMLNDKESMQNFLRDVMTENEITEISSRLEAARMLKNGCKYTEIVKETSLSSRTVARISHWLQDGCDGYEIALTALAERNQENAPARTP